MEPFVRWNTFAINSHEATTLSISSGYCYALMHCWVQFLANASLYYFIAFYVATKRYLCVNGRHDFMTYHQTDMFYTNIGIQLEQRD